MSFITTHLALIIVLSFFAVVYCAYRLTGIHKIADTVIRHPFISMLMSSIFVVVLAIGMKNLEIDADIKSILPHTIPCTEVTKKVEALFGGVDTVFIAVEAKNGTVWTPEILEKVKRISDELKKAPHVDKVLSLSEAKNVAHEDDTLSVRKFMDRVPQTPQEIEALRSLVKKNTILGSKLVSKDDTVALIIVTVKFNVTEMINGSEVTRKVSDNEICGYFPDQPDSPALGNLRAKYEDAAAAISLSGFTYIRSETFNNMVSDMNLFFPFSMALMLGFLFVCFRTLRGMLLPFAVVVMSLAALYGFIGWMGEKLYIPYVIIGPLFIAIAHNYGTQLIASYYEDAQAAGAGGEPHEIARSGIVKMGTPILLSAGTVVIGFVAMFGHPIPAIALLGYFSAFGIIVAFILTIVLTPALLSLLNVPPRLLKKDAGTLSSRLLVITAEIIMRFRKAVLVSMALIVLICIALIPRVQVDNNIIDFYKKDSPITKTFVMLGKKFSGAAAINILLEATKPVAPASADDGPMKDPATLVWMEKFQSHARSIRDPETGELLVGDIFSLADQLAYINKIMRGDEKQNRVPESKEMIAQYLLLFESAGGGDDLSSFVDYKYNNAQIILLMPDMKMRTVQIVLDSLNDYIQQHPVQAIALSYGGTLMYAQEISPLLVDGQINSIVISVIVIVLCYMIVFRSFSAGLFSSIPLVIAIFSVFGMMALFHIKLDYVTTILTSIMIGAGTDYTAYFLWRMREMTRKHNSLERAYLETMRTVAKGIVFNGFSVVIGFVVFFWSNFVPVIFFGLLIAASIFVCIIGSLTVLPAALLTVKPKFLFR